jgi:hypothetical protein
MGLARAGQEVKKAMELIRGGPISATRRALEISEMMRPQRDEVGARPDPLNL